MTTILVVKGSEYQAVCRGIKKSKVTGVKIIPIPMGVKPLKTYLEQLQLQEDRVLVLGLAGSLNPQYQLGDVVIYQKGLYLGKSLEANTDTIKLAQKATLVTGLTSDRLIHSASDKQKIRDLTQADVVDMESFPILEKFPQAAIIRVISDNYDQTLPDLNSAIDEKGNLAKIPLAIALCQQPQRAFQLIQSSLKALKILEQLTAKECRV